MSREPFTTDTKNMCVPCCSHVCSIFQAQTPHHVLAPVKPPEQWQNARVPSPLIQGPSARSPYPAPAPAAAAASKPGSVNPLVVQGATPQPAQPTPVVEVQAAHKQLKSYLPNELCQAFREAGMKHDLYDWQVFTSLHVIH